MISAKDNRLVRAVSAFVAVVCGGSIAAYIRQSTFTRFMADDFCGAADRAQMGILASLKDYYMTWDGRFVSDLLNLLIQGMAARWAAILPGVVITALVIVFYFAIYELAKSANFPVARMQSFSAALLLIYALLESAPSREQSFFWETGLVTYAVPLVFVGLYVIALLRLWQDPERKPLIVLVGALVFVAGGFSETLSAMQLTGLLLGWILWRFAENDRRATVMVPAIVGAALSFFIMAAAPGNGERHKTFLLYRPDYLQQSSDSVLWSLYQGYRWVWQHMATFFLCLVCSTTAALNSNRSIMEHSPSLANVRRFLLWNVAVFLVMCSSVAPAYFASGTHPPDRAMALTQFVLICVTCTWGWFVGKALKQSSPKLIPIAHGFLILLLIFPVLSTRSAWREAEQYRVYADMWDAEDASIRTAKARGEKAMVLRALPHWGGPGMESAGENPKNGLNVCIARYYGVDSVSYQTGH